MRHKKDKLITFDIAVLGDWVEFNLVEDSVGVIEEIKKRKNALSRKAGKARGALKRGERLEQVIASNIDTLYIVNSITNPDFNNRFLDRIIVSAESSKINVEIIINKIDLDDRNFSSRWEQFYKDIGYKVLLTSVKDNIGIDKLLNSLEGKVSLFWGRSGVGKSSLLNSISPELDLEIGEVSEYSGKGTHTTVSGEIFDLGNETYIVDTPGIREIDPYGIKKEDLSHYYKDFIPFIHDCKFNTCIHEHEPGCAIVNAVEEDLISIERYESYLNLLNTIEDDMFY